VDSRIGEICLGYQAEGVFNMCVNHLQGGEARTRRYQTPHPGGGVHRIKDLGLCGPVKGLSRKHQIIIQDKEGRKRG